MNALHAEWTKLRTLAATWWLLLAVIAVTVATGGVATAATTCPGAGCGQDPAKIALAGVDLGQALVATLAVLAVGGEYSTGMIGVTLIAMPRRLTVLTAKAAVVAGVVTVAGAIAVLGSVLAGRLVLPGRGFTPAHGYQTLSLASGPDLRAAGGSVLYLVLVALLALGTAVAVRESAAAVGTVLGLLYLFPVVASALAPRWSRLVQQAGPMTAGLTIQSTTALRTLPLTPWQGLGILTLWAMGALFVGGLLLKRRDA